MTTPSTPAPPAAPKKKSTVNTQSVSFQIGIAIVASVLGVIATRVVSVDRPVPTVASLAIPAALTVDPGASALALSPDGRTLAVAASGRGGRACLWLRELGRDELRPVVGTDGARQPFWSPDGRSLGFFASDSLRIIDLRTGVRTTLCPAPFPRGAAWGHETIVFQPDSSGPLWKIPAAGGPLTLATTLDVAAGEIDHCGPTFLPDRRHFLFSALGRGGVPHAIGTGDLRTTTSRTVAREGSGPVYSAGYLLMDRAGTVCAQRFDARSRRLSGDVRVVPGLTVESARGAGAPVASASRTGILVLMPHDAPPRAMLILDWRGLLDRP